MRNNIINSNIMNQLYKAQKEKLLLKTQLTLKFIVRDEKEQIEYFFPLNGVPSPLGGYISPG